jgi:hypothetical protein
MFGEYGVLAASLTDDRFAVVYFDFIDTTPTVTIPPKPTTESNAGTLTIDSANYFVSPYNLAEVNFSGMVFEYNKGHSVLVDVYHPDGEILTQKILVSSDKSFNVSIFFDDDDPVGVYTINAKYVDREFSPLTFTLDKVPEVILSPTNITLDPIPSTIPLDYGPFMVTGKLTTSDGTPISGKPVWMDADSGDGRNQGGNAITDSNGYFERELYFWHEADPGNWEVFVYFEGDSDYDLSASASRYITVEYLSAEPIVEPIEPSIPISLTLILDSIPSSVTEGDDILFSGVLITSDGATLIGDAEIQIKDDRAGIADSLIGVITTDERGEFAALWNAELRPTNGAYDFYAVFEDVDFGTQSERYSVNVIPQTVESILSTNLTLDPLPLSITTGESITFSGRLVTLEGVPISKQTILIKDDDTFGSDDLVAKAITDSLGYYENTITAKNWDASSGGASEIYAVFDSTDIYQGDRTLIYEIIVKSGIKNTTITFDKLPETVTEGELITFSGQLLTDEGIPLEGKTIYLKQDVLSDLDNLFATLTTDENGYFIVETSFTLPKYTEKFDGNFYVKWDGDAKNNSFRSLNQKMTLISANPVQDTTLSLNPLPNKIIEGENIIFAGQLLTADGIPLEGKTIHIKDDLDFDVDNILKSTTTNSNGEFKVSWNAVVRSSGSYDFYAVFESEEKLTKDKSLTYSVYVTAIQTFETIRAFSDDTVFEAGDSLVVYGTATPNEELEIALLDNDENIITSKTIQVTSSGSYSTILHNWNNVNNYGDYFVMTWSPIDQRYDGFWVTLIESIPEVFETEITLNRPSSSVILDDPIVFSGKVQTQDGSPIKNGYVVIGTFTAQNPELLAEGYTDSSGKYSITWYARQTSSFDTIPIFAFYEGNSVLNPSMSDKYDITLEKQSLSVFTEKSTYESGEQLYVYGYGNPNDQITVELKSPQGKVVDSKSAQVSSDGNYYAFFNLEDSSNGLYTIKVTSSSYGISDSVTIQIEKPKVVDVIDIVGNVYFNDYGDKPLSGIKTVLDVGATQYIDYSDSNGIFEFENIGYSPQLDYILHFEFTDGKLFNFVDGKKFDSDKYDNPDSDGDVITSKYLNLQLDNSDAINEFEIRLEKHLPYNSGDSLFITKAFGMQTNIVEFYSKVLNERPPIIDIFLFKGAGENGGGTWYWGTTWDSNTGKVKTGYSEPRINIQPTPDILDSLGMEYTHYAQDYSYKKMNGYDTRPMGSQGGNHFGFKNDSTADSWVEGVGTFMPAVIGHWYGLEGAGTFHHNNLESNDYKPYTEKIRYLNSFGDEEYSIATLLWDMYDSDNKTDEGKDNVSMRINQIWKLIKGYDAFSQHFPEHDSYGDRHIKYFKDFYDYMYDESSMSGDEIDDLFLLHGIPQGWSRDGRP